MLWLDSLDVNDEQQTDPNSESLTKIRPVRNICGGADLNWNSWLMDTNPSWDIPPVLIRSGVTPVHHKASSISLLKEKQVLAWCNLG